MGTTNAERQAAWRARRDAKLKEQLKEIRCTQAQAGAARGEAKK